MAHTDPPADNWETPHAELQELEPSPVEETPRESAKESYFPRASSTGTGLSGHSPTFYLLKIQKYSAYTFSFFTGLHFFNTAVVPLITRSVPASEPYLLLTRPLYQSPAPIPLEPLLVFGPAAAHVTSGLALRFYRRRAALKRSGAESRRDSKRVPWPAVSGTSKLGYGLMTWLSLHVFVNRAWPHLASVGEGGGGAEIGLGFVSHIFAKKSALAAPAYLMLLITGVGHMVWGGAKFWGKSPRQVAQTGPEGQNRKKKRWYLINATWAVVGLTWFAGLGVVVRGGEAAGWVGKQYDALLRGMPGLGRVFR